MSATRKKPVAKLNKKADTIKNSAKRHLVNYKVNKSELEHKQATTNARREFFKSLATQMIDNRYR